MAEDKQSYDIDTDNIMFQKGEHFDVCAVGAAQSPWWNRTSCEVNNSWVRLGVMEGDFHWHGAPPNHEQAVKALHELRTLGGKIRSEHE